MITRKMYNAYEVAKMIGTSQPTVLRWVKENRIIPDVITGRVCSFTSENIESIKVERTKYDRPCVKQKHINELIIT